MRKPLFLTIATSLTVGAFVMGQADPAPTDRVANQAERAADRAADKVDRAADKAEKKVERAAEGAGGSADAETGKQALALPAGVTAKNLDEQGDVRNAFEAITESAMRDDAFDNIVNRLVDADRDRISTLKDHKPNFKPLNERIAALRKSWRDKYDKDFDLDEKVVFGEGGYVAMALGEISDPQALAGNWPVKAQAGDARLASEQRPPAKPVPDAGKIAGGDANLNKGRNVAVARFPAGHGLPAIDASLIHENPDIWRFDLPDNIDGQKLLSNLVTQLNQVGTKGWPDDEKEAYRIVAHRVLMAMYDVQPDAGQRSQ